MEKAFKLAFSNGLTAQAVRIHRLAELSGALRELGLSDSRPVLVIIGGAGGLGDADTPLLRSLFVEVLAPLADTIDASVVDGGTDSGVMRLMGQARAETHATFPLVGVAAMGTVALPDASPPRPDAAPLEPNHTHFVLVPGSEWGDDSPWLVRVANTLANAGPSVTVLINGGEHTLQDASQSIEAGRPVIAVNGSGRAADILASALRGESLDGWARELVRSGLVKVVDLSSCSNALTEVIEQILFAKG